MHSVCTERESFVYLLSLMLTLAAVRKSTPFLERPWSVAQSKSHHAVFYLIAFQKGHHSFKTGKSDVIWVCAHCWLILEIMGMLQLSHGSWENKIVLFRTRWTARTEVTTSTYHWKRRGSGVFAWVIFLVNALCKRWFRNSTQWWNRGPSASYIRTLQRLIDIPFPPQWALPWACH